MLLSFAARFSFARFTTLFLHAMRCDAMRKKKFDDRISAALPTLLPPASPACFGWRCVHVCICQTKKKKFKKIAAVARAGNKNKVGQQQP